VVDTTTLIPGGNGASFVSIPGDPHRLLSGSVSFVGNGPAGLTGIYQRLYPGDPYRLLVDSSTLIPGSNTVAFNTFAGVSFDGLQAAFVGGATYAIDVFPFFATSSGVYKIPGNPVVPGNPVKIADLLTAVPGGIGTFLAFGQVVTDPGKVVFEGASSDGAGGLKSGLYTDFDGSLKKIVAVGDSLHGKTLTALTFGPQGFDSGQVVFAAKFADGSQAVESASLCSGLGFTGFLAPIGGADVTGGTPTDPVRAFQLKSTVPVKLILACGGAPFTTGAPTLQVLKVSASTDGDLPLDATPTDAATTGNAFRLTDPTTGEWHYNLATTGLSKGTWKLIVTLSDGNVHSAYIELK